MYRLIRKPLFAADAEAAPEFTAAQMVGLQRVPLALRAIEALCRTPPRPTQLLGLTFPTPIGIAAGFDKNALMMPFLAALGFGFVEVGTVTPRPQPRSEERRVGKECGARWATSD